MADVKHTPAPWRIEKCPCGHPSCNRYTTDNGSFMVGSGYSLADAHLIAAAPTLLEALDFIANVARLTSGFSPMALQGADRAIALAKGEKVDG